MGTIPPGPYSTLLSAGYTHILLSSKLPLLLVANHIISLQSEPDVPMGVTDTSQQVTV